MSYAKGKHAFGFCDRTGFRYPLKDLVPEYRNGVKTGFLVGRDVVDPDQPQNFLGRIKINDPQSLRNPRPDTSLLASRAIVGFDPVGNPAVIATGSVGRVTITIIYFLRSCVLFTRNYVFWPIKSTKCPIILGANMAMKS